MQRYLDVLKKRLPHGFKQLQPSKHDNIIIAMSSGVDSSVSAALFSSFPKARGVYMRNWNNKQNDMKNCDEKDWNDARKVAEYLNLPIEMVNFEKEYWIDVFEPMLQSYELGVTPNPDVLCNRYIKFGSLKRNLDEKYGRDNYWLVTGHYSRILQNMGTSQFELWRGVDMSKDQSYYLSQVKPNALNQVLLPMGHFYKKEVRALAQDLQLPTAQKPDSQGICFVNNSQQGNFKSFLREYLPIERGDVVTIDPDRGKKTVWGQHDGLWSYTLGQKIGIAMPQGDPKYRGTWFVSEKLKDTNEIVIVKGRENPKLFRDNVVLTKMKWLMEGEINPMDILQDAVKNGSLFMQYRSLQKPIPIKECKSSPDMADCHLELLLKKPQRAMAPGQYGCLYLQDRVIGSGIILSSAT
ncbi:mitochondrial tRNA-specific 2-thiouridylase 1 [Monosporozyma unispora]|nr:hypothetical protein C6P44_001213 [Kazachstania unispora]